MPPTLILVRHAQALHNVAKDYSLHDPVLSELGRNQCSALRESLMGNPLARRATRIVISPMRRTLETALLSLDWLMTTAAENTVKVEADADWQENSDKPCDTGSDLATIMDEFSPKSTGNSSSSMINWDRVKASSFPDKTSPASPYAFTRTAILGRAQRALERLYKECADDEVVIVVAHSGFLRLGVTGCCYFNADFRVFDFDEVKEEGAGMATYRLTQHESTRESGGGLGLSLKEMLVLGSDLPDETPPSDS